MLPFVMPRLRAIKYEIAEYKLWPRIRITLEILGTAVIVLGIGVGAVIARIAEWQFFAALCFATVALLGSMIAWCVTHIRLAWQAAIQANTQLIRLPSALDHAA